MLFADQRTPVDRLELALPWGDPAVDAALKLGFEVVSRRVGRLDDGRDEVLLDRLRSSFIPCEPPLMTLPPRSAEPLPDFTWRGLTERDAAEVRALSLGASALAGTLQVPSANTAYYAERHANTPAGHQIRVMASAHGLIGIVGAHPTEYQGVFSLGMTIGERWQGRGAGRLALQQAITLASETGARRIELGVYEDNQRAMALYQAAGFVVEGTRRYEMLREGGHASTVEMRLASAGTP